MNRLNKWLSDSLPGKKIVVIGSGSLGKLTVDCILRNGKYLPNNIAILDDNPEVHGSELLGVPVIGSIDRVNDLKIREDIAFVIAIANNNIRKKIATTYPALRYKSIISNKATISPFAKIGLGCIILHGTIVDPDADIRNHVVINKLATIAHDVILHDFSQVSPGVNFGGYVELGDCSFMGLGSAILPNVKVQEDIVIGAGAIVTKDIVESSSIYVGSPARFLKKEINLSCNVPRIATIY